MKLREEMMEQRKSLIIDYHVNVDHPGVERTSRDETAVLCRANIKLVNQNDFPEMDVK